LQTQVFGLLDIPINPVFSKRFSTPSDFRGATVVDFVAARLAFREQWNRKLA